MSKSKTFVGRLCAIAHEQKLLDEKQAKELSQTFAEKSRLEFENFLVSEGFLARQDLLKVLSKLYGVPAFDASGYFFDHYLVTRFPKEFLRQESIVPLSVDDDAILIMIAAIPDDPDIAEAAERYVSWDVQCMVGLYQDIQDAIEEYYDESLTVTDENEYVPEQERDERKALDIAERTIKSS